MCSEMKHNVGSDNFVTIGLMSGTSLDGVDIAACRFFPTSGSWGYEILHAETYPYTAEWRDELSHLETASALTLTSIHTQYGKYLGILVREFILNKGINANLVASHGHTIFHQPGNGFTLQIGHGAAIAAECNIPVVSDFRSLDVALGGQGAPLVPIGDKLLFGHYSQCLNLGGFCNISYEIDGVREAFDIAPCNIVLNHYSEYLNIPFDKDGLIAAQGQISEPLLEALSALPYYSLGTPKSLGKEWVLREFLPVVDCYEISISDKLRTVSEHIAIQISKVVNKAPSGNILVTGGGALNQFLVTRIENLSNFRIVIPDAETINFKEALIFAFLGFLRFQGKINVLKSVTGSKRDHSGGSIFLP